MTAPHPDVHLRDAALSGAPAAARALVGRLIPIIQARVGRCLARHGRPELRRNVREEVMDLTQEVLLSLFANEGRALRAWNPERGLSLDNFIGMVAQRQALSLLRTQRNSPWMEEPIEDLGAELPDAEGPEARVASRQVLERLLLDLEAELSPLGLELFELLVVQELDAAEVVERTGLSRDAVYAWRSRLGKLVRQRAEALAAAEESGAARAGVKS
ncbi:MAG: sigma-70 family RNA polymerase sigma factor [Myxococcota bacterium]